MNRQRVAIVTFESVQILDVTGPLEVLATATRLVPSAHYETHLASLGGGPITASSGLTFDTTSLDNIPDPIDTLIVAGGRDMDAVCNNHHLVTRVEELASRSRRVASVCSGAFLLAATGVLDGRRAVTHWAECQLLARSYPHVNVDPDAIYLRDGNLWTSAGVTAGIDLTLALVADDHGRQAAATVARQLVVYLRRSGGQSQYSNLLAAQDADSQPIQDLLAWLPDHLTDDLSIPRLAQRANLSERHFNRRFKAEVGVAPAQHIEALRLESARRLIETTNLPIEQIATTCGFGAVETMNRAFRRRLDITPLEHRHHFTQVS